MNKIVKYVLITLLLLTNQFVPTKCLNCEHICDENCEYIEEICQHECEYFIQPLERWDPWD